MGSSNEIKGAYFNTSEACVYYLHFCEFKGTLWCDEDHSEWTIIELFPPYPGYYRNFIKDPRGDPRLYSKEEICKEPVHFLLVRPFEGHSIEDLQNGRVGVDLAFTLELPLLGTISSREMYKMRDATLYSTYEEPILELIRSLGYYKKFEIKYSQNLEEGASYFLILDDILEEKIPWRGIPYKCNISAKMVCSETNRPVFVAEICPPLPGKLIHRKEPIVNVVIEPVIPVISLEEAVVKKIWVRLLGPQTSSEKIVQASEPVSLGVARIFRSYKEVLQTYEKEGKLSVGQYFWYFT